MEEITALHFNSKHERSILSLMLNDVFIMEVKGNIFIHKFDVRKTVFDQEEEIKIIPN